jgi:hypothetical protein
MKRKPKKDWRQHVAILRQNEPCKNKSRECAVDGSCLRCGADQGVACRDPQNNS